MFGTSKKKRDSKADERHQKALEEMRRLTERIPEMDKDQIKHSLQVLSAAIPIDLPI